MCVCVCEREREREREKEREREDKQCRQAPENTSSKGGKRRLCDGFDRTALLFVAFWRSCIERVDAVMIHLSPDILADVV